MKGRSSAQLTSLFSVLVLPLIPHKKLMQSWLISPVPTKRIDTLWEARKQAKCLQALEKSSNNANRFHSEFRYRVYHGFRFGHIPGATPPRKELQTIPILSNFKLLNILQIAPEFDAILYPKRTDRAHCRRAQMDGHTQSSSPPLKIILSLSGSQSSHPHSAGLGKCAPPANNAGEIRARYHTRQL